MKKKSRNLKTLELSLPAGMRIGVSDACFRVRNNDGIIGELQVSKGSLVWFPRDAKKGYRIGWNRFDRLMCDMGMQCEDR